MLCQLRECYRSARDDDETQLLKNENYLPFSFLLYHLKKKSCDGNDDGHMLGWMTSSVSAATTLLVTVAERLKVRDVTIRYFLMMADFS